jgi:hypothetical protein
MEMLMVPPMTPTVSTLAPFGATSEFGFCAWTILGRHVSTTAPSICLFTCIFVRSSGQSYSRAGWSTIRKLGGSNAKKNRRSERWGENRAQQAEGQNRCHDV